MQFRPVAPDEGLERAEDRHKRRCIRLNNKIYNEVIGQGDPLASLLVYVRWRVLGWSRLGAEEAMGIPRETIAANEQPRTAEGTRFHNRIFHAILAAWQQHGVPAQYCCALIKHVLGASRHSLYGAFQEQWLREGIPAFEKRTKMTKGSIDQVQIAGNPLPYRTIAAAFASGDPPAVPASVLNRWREETIAFDAVRHVPLPLAQLRWYLEERHGTTSYLTLHALGMAQQHARRLSSGFMVPWKALSDGVRSLVPTTARKDFAEAWQRAYEDETNRTTFRSEAQRLKAERGISNFTLARFLGLPRGKRWTSALRLPQEETGYVLPGGVAPGVLAHLLCDSRKALQDLIRLYEQERRELHLRTGEGWNALRHLQELWRADERSLAKHMQSTQRAVRALLREHSSPDSAAALALYSAIEAIGKQKCEEALERRREYLSPTNVLSAIQKCSEIAAQGSGNEGYLALAKRIPGIAPATLRAIAQGGHVPAWPTFVRIVEAGGGVVNERLKADWAERFAVQLKREHKPLVRVLSFIMQEEAENITVFSKDRSRFSCAAPTVLRRFPALDRGEVVRWEHIERILLAADIRPRSPRWRFVEILWKNGQDIPAAIDEWRRAVQRKRKRPLPEDFRSLPGITAREIVRGKTTRA